jgi:ABC-type multidrug transport system fused ATPase/permease subunit
MFVVDIERFRALCALYFLNTIQPEELEELKSALNSGETELRKIFNQAKKAVKESYPSGRFIDTYIDDNESYVKESKSKGVWNYSFFRLFLSYWFSKIKIKLLLAISFILFASFIILSFYTNQLANEVKEMKVGITLQKSELNRKEELFSILQSKDIVLFNMDGQNIDPEGYGRIIWSPAAQQALLQVTGLPTVGKGKVYMLWLLKDKIYINKGVISLNNDDSENIFNIGNIPVVKNDLNYSFLVTLEKEGNNSKPTGVVYLIGKAGK